MYIKLNLCTHRCLPLDYMGFYCLAGYETDKRHRATVRSYMVADVEKRREYIKSLMMAASERASEQLPMIMPDYMLVFSVPVLTHNPRFTSFDNEKELVNFQAFFSAIKNSTCLFYISYDLQAEIKECLWFVLEPLIVKNDSYSFGFYKALVERMKNHKDAMEPDNDDVNFVSIKFGVPWFLEIYQGCMC